MITNILAIHIFIFRWYAGDKVKVTRFFIKANCFPRWISL